MTPAVSKASSGAMEMMPVYAVSGMEKFLAEAGSNGWTVLGTVGMERLNKAETGSEKQEMKRGSRKPVIDCREYVVEGPTVVVLGE